MGESEILRILLIYESLGPVAGAIFWLAWMLYTATAGGASGIDAYHASGFGKV